MYTYTSSGGLKITNCAGPNTILANVISAFDEGDFAYIKKSAQNGKLERIHIKLINVISTYSYNYKDSFNRVWLEHELVDLDEAESLIQAFGVRSHARYLKSIQNCTATFS